MIIPIAIPPTTPPAIAPAIAPVLEGLLLGIGSYCAKVPSGMLVAPGTQRETSGPLRVVPSITVVGTTKGGKGGSEVGADADAGKLVPGGEEVGSSWVRTNESIFRSISSVALVFVMVIV